MFHDVSLDTSGEIVEHLLVEAERPPVLEEELREATELIRGDKKLAPLLRRRRVELEVISPAGDWSGRRIALRLIQGMPAGEVRDLAVVELDLDVGEIVASDVFEGARSR